MLLVDARWLIGHHELVARRRHEQLAGQDRVVLFFERLNILRDNHLSLGSSVRRVGRKDPHAVLEPLDARRSTGGPLSPLSGHH